MLFIDLLLATTDFYVQIIILMFETKILIFELFDFRHVARVYFVQTRIVCANVIGMFLYHHQLKLLMLPVPCLKNTCIPFFNLSIQNR